MLENCKVTILYDRVPNSSPPSPLIRMSNFAVIRPSSEEVGSANVPVPFSILICSVTDQPLIVALLTLFVFLFFVCLCPLCLPFFPFFFSFYSACACIVTLLIWYKS